MTPDVSVGVEGESPVGDRSGPRSTPRRDVFEGALEDARQVLPQLLSVIHVADDAVIDGAEVRV